jgi:hypothetical protein
MNIKELHSFKLSDAVKFHDKLNPKLWVGMKMQPVVRNSLLKIASDFLDYLGISSLDVKDITLSGSNAAYSYTDHSDIDLHIVVDFNKLNPDDVYQELFASKKNLYNEGHKIKIRDISVECYVQDSNQPHVSLGEYSILNNKWLKIPSKRRANFDQTATRAKYEKLKHVVEHALKSTDPKFISNLLLKIKRYRSAGLEKGGEFSPENLAYKAIKSQGVIDKLYKRRDLMHGRQLSIENTVNEGRKLTDLVAQFQQALKETKFDYSNVPSREDFINNYAIREAFQQKVARHCWDRMDLGESFADIQASLVFGHFF